MRMLMCTSCVCSYAFSRKNNDIKMTIGHVTSPTTLAVVKALEILFAYMTCFRIIHLNWLSKHRRLCHTDAWQMLGYFTLSLTLTFSAKRCSAWFFNQFSSLAINMELNQNAVCKCWKWISGIFAGCSCSIPLQHIEVYHGELLSILTSCDADNYEYVDSKDSVSTFEDLREAYATIK